MTTFKQDQKAIYNESIRTVERYSKETLADYQIALKRLKEKLSLYKGKNIPEVARLENLIKDIESEISSLMRRRYIRMKGAIKGQTIRVYYETLFAVEKSVNTEMGLDYDYQLNAAPLNTAAITAAYSGRIAGSTLLERNAFERTRLQFDIRQTLSQVFIEGQTIKEFEKRLKGLDDVFEKSYAKTQATARTELLRAHSIGNELAVIEDEKSGVKFSAPIWDATLDSRVRPTHARADQKKAKKVNGDYVFNVGGVLFIAPRLVSSHNKKEKTAGEVVNCRCRKENVIKGFQPTKRVARRKDGTWEKVNKNVSAKKWAKREYDIKI